MTEETFRVKTRAPSAKPGLLTLTITVSHPQLQTPITLQTRVVP